MSHPIKLTEIAPKLAVGSQFYCSHTHHHETAIIHANHACHQYAVGYQLRLPDTHPNFWLLERQHHLYLSFSDSERPVFVPSIFRRALKFIQKHIGTRKVIIHSRQGLSRAPSIAMLYMAKVTGSLDNASYDAASNAFVKLYPSYQPARGLVTYLRREWHNPKLVPPVLED